MTLYFFISPNLNEQIAFFLHIEIQTPLKNDGQVVLVQEL